MKKKRKKKVNPIYIILIAMVLYIGWIFLDQQIKLDDLKAEEAALIEEVENLKQEEQRLKQEKDMIDDPEYIEKIARKRLKMVKPNEIIYIDQERAKFNY